jgi:hypothetical protein
MNSLRLWESYESPPASVQANLTFGDEGDIAKVILQLANPISR